MGLLDDILEWSEGLPIWQRDALRRLFVHRALTPSDHAELIAMVKEEHGNGEPANVRPIPLTADDIPLASARSNVRLKSIDQLQHVNLLPNGQVIEFATDGLNVLFGENGAGKSGYARILKNACRARVRQPVLPNAFDKQTPRPTPSARLTVIVNGEEEHSVVWSQGTNADRALGNITVYDSACGSDYIGREGVSDYQPYGLPYLRRLADAQLAMLAIIDDERKQIRTDPQGYADLLGEHEVGQLLAKLSKDTDIERLRALAVLSEDEATRLNELSKVLGTMNPEPDAQRAERLAGRLEAASTTAQQNQRYVTDRALDEVRHRLSNERAAKNALAIAQQRLGNDDEGQPIELLAGTGNDAWKVLFQAAEAFSTKYAYPDHTHPNLGDNAKCVLCQTPLDDDAKERMRRFSAYLVEAASKEAEDTAQRMKDTMTAIGSFSVTPVDVPTLEELNGVDPELHAFVGQATTSWKSRRTWVEACVKNNDWNTERPALPEGDPLDERLKAKAKDLRSHAKELRAALDPGVKGKLEAELHALTARRNLADRLDLVERQVNDAALHHRLSNCHSALGPRKVSLKMTALAATYVTGELANAMTEELIALGNRRKVIPAIEGRTDLGQTIVTLKIKDCENAPGAVLSEGEQRAMSLALFLAELRLQGHSSTVVFDDPATSLDHRHRRHMAARIVALADERPVLVFTHDAVFLTEIGIAAKANEQPVAYQTISWGAQAAGVVSQGLTWETMDAATRLKALNDIVKPLGDYRADYMDEATKEHVKTGYTKLRGTIERAVREVFLNNTVRPFSDEISVGSFGAVIGHPPEEWAQVSDLYDRCCEVTDAHDTNAEHQLTLPEPKDLLADIKAFENLLIGAKKRRSEYEAKRAKQNDIRRKPFN